MGLNIYAYKSDVYARHIKRAPQIPPPEKLPIFAQIFVVFIHLIGQYCSLDQSISEIEHSRFPPSILALRCTKKWKNIVFYAAYFANYFYLCTNLQSAHRALWESYWNDILTQVVVLYNPLQASQERQVDGWVPRRCEQLWQRHCRRVLFP